MNLEDILKAESDRLAQDLQTSLLKRPEAYTGNWTWANQIRPPRRYTIREYYSGTMNGTPLYTSVMTGAKHLLRGERVKSDEPGGSVYGIWDNEEQKLLTAWPNQKTAEGVLRMLQ